ncbi:MAG: hypothetical protein RL077_4219, partial [Verrucomicrobiota bacterium]
VSQGLTWSQASEASGIKRSEESVFERSAAGVAFEVGFGLSELRKTDTVNGKLRFASVYLMMGSASKKM